MKRINIKWTYIVYDDLSVSTNIGRKSREEDEPDQVENTMARGYIIIIIHNSNDTDRDSNIPWNYGTLV